MPLEILWEDLTLGGLNTRLSFWFSGALGTNLVSSHQCFPLGSSFWRHANSAADNLLLMHSLALTASK